VVHLCCAREPRGEVGQLLTESRGTRRLPVSAGGHRGLRVPMGERGQLTGAGGENRQQRRPRLLQQARIAQVVDVLGGAAEVHQLESRGCGSCPGELFAHVVLDRLHVVVDARLDGFHGRRRRLGRRLRELLGARAHRAAQARTGELRHGRGELQQPVCLDADALADQPGLGE